MPTTGNVSSYIICIIKAGHKSLQNMWHKNRTHAITECVSQCVCHENRIHKNDIICVTEKDTINCAIGVIKNRTHIGTKYMS